jgi:hypothetical protein
MLLLAVVVAVPCAWLPHEVTIARRQDIALQKIKGMSGAVEWNEQPEPAWLRTSMGEDFFRRVRSVDFDAGMARPRRPIQHRAASAIETLEISVRDIRPWGLRWCGSVLGEDKFQRVLGVPIDGTQASDPGLEPIKGFDDLRTLNLCDTQVSDSGLRHIKGLNHLRVLRLDGLNITDSGLEHLQALDELEGLGLAGTLVTDAGIAHLRTLNRLRVLALDETRVTDAGLVYLTGLDRLEVLGLEGTRDTGAGVRKLQDALPNCVMFVAHRSQ